jgi:SAM-dependent methyltransferase
VSEFSTTYDTLAPRWDDWTRRVTPTGCREAWVRRIDEYVHAGERVAELGCGTGKPVGALLASRYAYTGVDASPGMLAGARSLLGDAVTLLHSDMESASFDTGSLGAVAAFFSIIHVPREHHARLFASIASWLRAGGCFVGTLHSRDDPDDYSPDWLDAGPMRWSGFDRDTNLALLDAAGFDVLDAEVVEQVEPDGCIIHPLFVLARRR